MYKNNSYNNREELNQCIKLDWDNTEKLKSQKFVYVCIHLQSIWDRQCKKWSVLLWKWEQCDWLESPVLHGTVLAKCFSPSDIWARTAPQVKTESMSLRTIKKTSICLYLISPSCTQASVWWFLLVILLYPWEWIVSYAAVLCLVKQRSSPRTAAENRTTFLSQLLPNQA